ncbi:MAG: GNAT family N-acetyltransferase [Acidimicrobiales bacterium]
MAHDTTSECSFVTDRLTVVPWHGAAEADLTIADAVEASEIDPFDAVAAVLTERTTEWLPNEWRGNYDRARAQAWLQERDAESPTLLIIDRGLGSAVGLLILFETTMPGTTLDLDVRFGYVLAEPVWGSGLATELVAGLVTWARSQPRIRFLTGGVALENAASARVLEKNGFVGSEPRDGERTYELDVARRAD